MAHQASDFKVLNSTAEDVTILNLALVYLDKSPIAQANIDKPASSGAAINFLHNGTDAYYNGIIDWDPHSGLIVELDPIVKLGLEAGHER